MSSENGVVRKVQLVKEESPFSMSDEDSHDSLEIKPPQASSHKTHSHRSHKDKHSSHRSHSNSQDVKSSSQHKSHHRSRHRDERDRRHHHKDKERSSKPNPATDNVKSSQLEREVSYKSHRHRGDDRKHRDDKKSRDVNNERKKRDNNRYLEELQAQEADLRARLDRKKHSNPLKEKEKLERELRKERFLEAERVKEAYKERVKDVEQKRKRYQTRSRSRSPVKSKNLTNDEGSPPAARSRKEMEEAGLVVVTDESRSPTPQRQTPPRQSAQPEEMEEEHVSGESEKEGSDKSGESSSSADQSEDSISDSEDEDDSNGVEDIDSSEGNIEDTSPHIIVSTNDQDIDMEIELEKDTLPPYLPAIQGCRSVEEFKCLNRIEEGTYGVVYRAKDKRTEEIVALKRLKMEKEKEGFPITSLREINTLLKAQHPNIVTVREIVVGSNMDKIFIVMDYVEHDIKSLMETMKLKKQVFMPGEVKCLMQQLLNAVAHLHDNWILHRDLKTSNLLLSHKGILKVGDFGLAREYGSPLKHYTPIVVTLWYRSPELLLGCKEYSTHIDIWSVGCIFAEFLAMEPLFPGKSDLDQLNRIFKTIGTPNEKIWIGFSKLPAVQKMSFAEYPNTGALKMKLSGILTEVGHDLLMKFLTYDPVKRTTAEEALKHDYFTETPLPIDPAMFPTWPAKSELGYKKAMSSPKPPSGGQNYKQLEDNEEGFHMGMIERSRTTVPGFSLKF